MATPPTLLSFDTSAAHCAAAIVSGGRVIAARDEVMMKGQAERLMPMIEELLGAAGMGWGALHAVAVGIGPGNFTGVRLSVAAARAIALARGIPAHGVTLFEALALDAPRPLLALVDARQDRLYLQRFDREIGDPRLMAMAEIGRDMGAPELPGLWVTGDRADEVAARIGAETCAPAHPVAEAIALIAQMRPAPTVRPAPLYLKPADAAPSRDRPPVLLP